MTRKQKKTMVTCAILSLLSIIALFTGIYFKMPLIIASVMIPVVFYEMIKTKGIYTKFFSFICFLIVITIIYSLIIGLKVDMSGTGGGIFKYIPGFSGTIQAGLIASVIIIILTLFMLRRSAGIYAIWLSVITLILAVVLFYVTGPGSSSDQPDIEKTQEINIQENNINEVNTDNEI